MLTAVAISLGALARWQLGLWLSPLPSHVALPWGTLAANWTGAYAIGAAVMFFQSQTQIDPAWRLAIITGFLGALTTFSLEVVSMLQHGRWLLGESTASLLVFGSLLLTWAGMRSAVAWLASV